MEAEDQQLDELADAVLEGDFVDWASAESSPGGPTPEVVQQLKVLAGIAELHRKLTRDTPVSQQHRVPEGRLEHWGRLEIHERIGQGSFGEVYRARDLKLDREVAVKLLHPDGAQASPKTTDARGVISSEGTTQGPESATVLEEARLLARVRHPNVVTVYDADEIEGRVGLWMEFIHGRNLEQVLGERKTFDDRAVTQVGIELCRALSAVHEAGLLHRDIKAQNLMQADDGRLILMDFGTGRELEGRPASSVDAAGTPLYLAPEIFSGAQATVRADIYSAGVVLFHLLTGAYPVRGATVKEIGAAHARGERLDLAATAPGVDRALAAAIGRALEPDPSKRFESARDMLATLENVHRRTQGRKAKRYGLALGAVSLVAIALAAVSGWLRRDPGGDSKGKAGGAAYVGSTPEKRAVKTPNDMMAGTPSPDGRYLPYFDFATGNLALYEFESGASRTLTKTADGGDENMAWPSVVSADSSRIAYSREDGSCQCTELRVIDADGANDRLLHGGSGITEIVPLEWTLDGRQILGTRTHSGGQTDVLLLSVLDGSVQLIRTLSNNPGRVTLSPDSFYIAYDRAEDPYNRDRGIYLSEVAGKGEFPVVTGPTYDWHPMWTPDGSGLVFESMRTGGPGLWLQRIKDGRADGKHQLLDKDMGPFRPLTLTRQGSLFYDHRTGLMDVYTAPIDPATGDVTGEPTNAASHVLGSNLSSDWSPDGDTLVFASWRTFYGPGCNILVLHSMSSGTERELEVDVNVVNLPRWSPDGRVIAIGGPDRMGVDGLRLVDAETGRIVSTFLAQSGDRPPFTSLAWDPDGRHAYLRRNPGSISRIDTNTGEEQLVYKPPPDSFLGSSLSISPDGRRLAFSLFLRQAKSFRLIVITTDGGRPRELVSTPETGSLHVGGWTRDGRHILFTRPTPDQTDDGELWAVPSDGGVPHRLGLSRHALRDVRVSPDGSRISFTAGFPDRAMWVFENFLRQTASP